MDRRQLVTIVVGTVIVTTLGYFFFQDRGLTRVQAVGSLLFTFTGVLPDSKVFDEMDVKPGDCYTRTVEVTNEGSSDADVAVRAEDVVDEDGLASIFSMLITEGATTLYEDTVQQFLTDGQSLVDGVALSTVSAGGSTIYSFEVCMPAEAGNEYQEKTMTFDLVFGTTHIPDETPTPTPSIPVPPECKELEGLIDRVYYADEDGGYLHGSIYNDLIYGSEVKDNIDGSGGNDCIIGGGGNDHLEGEDGNDIIVGGAGNDTIWLGSGNDIGWGNEGKDTIEAGSGNDKVWGGEGDDRINAGSGDDLVYGEAGNDVIDGMGGLDELHGGDGNDTLRGWSDPDKLYGENDDDTLAGGSGDDLLDGGSGIDTLTGNTGNDTCVAGETEVLCEL